MKTYNGKVVHPRSDWKTSLFEDFKVGDYVEFDIAQEIAECVPPAYYSSSLIQCGEPYSYRNGKKTYMTFKNVIGGIEEDSIWEFCGDCPFGQTEQGA